MAKTSAILEKEASLMIQQNEMFNNETKKKLEIKSKKIEMTKYTKIQ